MRVLVCGVITLWLAPVISVGFIGIGMPHLAAILTGLIVAAAVGALTARPAAGAVAPAPSGRPLLAAAAVLAAAAAIVQIGRRRAEMPVQRLTSFTTRRGCR